MDNHGRLETSSFEIELDNGQAFRIERVQDNVVIQLQTTIKELDGVRFRYPSAIGAMTIKAFEEMAQLLIEGPLD